MQEFQEAVGGVVNVSFTAARDGIMAVSSMPFRCNYQKKGTIKKSVK